MEDLGLTTLFGSREDFAIEAGVEPDLKPPSSVWGHMCVWCRGVPLGNLTEHYCALYPAYRGFQRLAHRVDELWAPELASLDDVTAWNFLDGLLFGYHGEIEILDDRTIEQIRADCEMWSRFDFLTNWGEQFDGQKAFILRPPEGPICVLARGPDRNLHSFEISRSALVAVSEAFVLWFKEQESRLRGSDA